MGNLCIILQSLSSGASLLFWALNQDTCDHSSCLPDFPERTLPFGLLVNLIVATAVFPMFYKSHDALVALVSIAISFSMLLASLFILHAATRDYISTISIFVFISVSIAIFEDSVHVNYTLYAKFETSLRERLASENKEYLMELQTDQMRHMIGK